MFEKDVYKNKMVYLVKGVLEILSTEDEDTPILSLSPGTCIGETTLLIPYHSQVFVRCKTHCIVHILTRKQFVIICHSYMEDYHQIQAQVAARYRSAIWHENITRNIDPINKFDFSRSVLTIRFLKFKINELFGRVSKKFDEKSLEVDSYNRLIFYGDYIDMISISDVIDLVQDSVVIRAECPFILRNNSKFLKAWEHLILILVLVSVIILPYNLSFTDDIPQWHETLVNMVTMVWCIDIYIQISTSYDTRDEVVAEIDRIVLERMSYVYFWIELCAALPIDKMILVTNLAKIPRLTNFFQLNRLLKISRFNRYIFYLQNTLQYSVSGLECCKIIFFACTYLYLMASILCFVNFLATRHFHSFKWHEDASGEQTMLRFFKYLYIVTKLTARSEIEDISPSIYSEVWSISILLIITIIIDMLIKSNLIAVYLLDSVRYMDVFEQIWHLKDTSRAYRLHYLTQKRIKDYMTYVVQFRKNYEVSQYLEYVKPPDFLISRGRSDLFSYLFNHHKAFQESDPRFIQEICEHLDRKILPINEVLFYKRDAVRQLYIICSGTCKLLQNKYAPNRFFQTGDFVAMLEFFLEKPCLHTIILESTCYFVSISYKDFVQVLNKYPDELQGLNRSIESSLIEFENYHPLRTVEYNIYKPYMKTERPSYQKFKKDVETFDDVVYELGFKSSFFGFLRPLLLPRTFLPDGRFLIYWEGKRCLFAIASALLFTNSIIIFGSTWTKWKYALEFLDCMAYADLYVQMHVCFYNQNKILVTHPLKTCLHYLTHRFLLDLFACFRFEYLIVANTNWLFVLIKLNRVLQCYRIYGFLEYVYGAHIQGLILLKFFGYGFLLYILSCAAGVYLLSLQCTFKDSYPGDLITGPGVKCLNNSWITNSLFTKPLTNVQVYLYGIYFGSSLLSLTGHDGISSNSYYTALNIMCITIFAYIGNFLFLNTMIYGIFFRSQELLIYKGKMSALLRYVDSGKIDKSLRASVLEHFQRTWDFRARKQIFDVTADFPTPLKQDVLFECFFTNLSECRGFKNANPDFFRRILIKMKYLTILKNQEIVRCQDIITTVYFILSGWIDVYDKYGRKMAVLSPGSLFGNLQERESLKHDFLLISATQLHLLVLENKHFYEILKYYPTLYENFLEIIQAPQNELLALSEQFSFTLDGKHEDHDSFIQKLMHVKTKFIAQEENTDEVLAKEAVIKQALDKTWFLFMPDSTFSVIWEFFFVFFIVFFQFFIEVYCVGVTHNTPATVYILEALYLLNMFIICNSAYEDDDGIIVYNKKKIMRHYFRSTGFILDVIVMLPIYIVIAIFFSQQSQEILGPWSRINKLVCIHHFITNIRKRQSYMGSNIFLTRLFIVFTWTTLLIHFTACIQIGFLRYGDVSLHLTEEILLTKFHLYVMHAYAVQNIFFSSVVHGYYPDSPYMTIYFIIMMIIFRLTQYVMIAEICSSLSDTLVFRNVYFAKLFALSNYMTFGDTSEGLTKQTWTFALRLWTWRHGMHTPELLSDAPRYLQEDINSALYGDIFYEHPIFWKCEQTFLRQMIRQVRLLNFFTNDYIAFEGDTTNSLYVVVQGLVGVETTSILDEVDALAEVRLKRGALFGIASGLLRHEKLRYTYKALKTSSILELNYYRWEYLLDHFPTTKQHLYEIFKDGNKIYFQELVARKDEWFEEDPEEPEVPATEEPVPDLVQENLITNESAIEKPKNESTIEEATSEPDKEEPTRNETSDEAEVGKEEATSDETATEETIVSEPTKDKSASDKPTKPNA